MDLFLDENPRSTLQEDVVDGFINELFEMAKKHIEDKAKDYKYTLKSEAMIMNIILELFDSCYLAFDEEESV